MQNQVNKIIINGRFLTQGLTGVQRVAFEIVHALDTLLSQGMLPAGLQQAQWVILTPKHTAHHLSLKSIRIQETGTLKGHAWEQLDLYLAARNHPLLNFCNSGPVLHHRQFVMLHDACVYRHPEFYSRAYRILHQTLGHLLARRAVIGTVSEFSQRELASILKLPAPSIGVFYNGVNHMQRVQPDAQIIDKLGLGHTPYFLCIGSLTKNKNVQLAVDALQKLNNTNARLVIVGGGNNRIFGKTTTDYPPNITFTGRLSDAEIAALLKSATAFIFPSIYEGFGLPPLEAMAMGCPVLASTAQAVVEVCGDTATYFDAHDSASLAHLMQLAVTNQTRYPAQLEKTAAHLKNFTWEANAVNIANFIHAKGLI